MGGHSKDDWVNDDPDKPGDPAAAGVPPSDDEVVDAEIVDAEIVDAEIIDDAFLSDEDHALLDEARADLSDEVPFVDGTLGRSDLAAERDEYRDALLRVKADFENYRKRNIKDQDAIIERATGKLVADLLPVLDACEAALGHGSEDVEPIFKSLLDVLEKGGLVRMIPEGQPFDPNLHEAVIHEPSDDDETIVLESLRRGYLWNGRVVRPAMVKVKG